MKIILSFFLAFNLFGNEYCDDIDKLTPSWKNSVNSGKLPYPLNEFLKVNRSFLEKTPLFELPIMSELVGKRVLLKDDSQQINQSFKIRGVLHEIIMAIQRVLDSALLGDLKAINELNLGLKIVTQSTGNHGMNVISGVEKAIDYFLGLSKYSKYFVQISNIEPVVFASSGISRVKRIGMEDALISIRKKFGQSRGKLILDYDNYDDAQLARIKYINDLAGVAKYMEHAGDDIMVGHGTLGIEVAEQLLEMGIDEAQKVTLVTPVGGGGTLGFVAGLKAKRSNSEGIFVQTPNYDALVKILHKIDREGNMIDYLQNIDTDKDIKNTDQPVPTEIHEKTKIFFADGIAVGRPEVNSVRIAKSIMDEGIVTDEFKAYRYASTLLAKDSRDYYSSRGQTSRYLGIGGTTAAAAQAILGRKSKSIESSDIVILVGTEGNILDEIKKDQEEALERVDSIKKGYLGEVNP